MKLKRCMMAVLLSNMLVTSMAPVVGLAADDGEKLSEITETQTSEEGTLNSTTASETSFEQTVESSEQTEESVEEIVTEEKSNNDQGDLFSSEVVDQDEVRAQAMAQLKTRSADTSAFISSVAAEAKMLGTKYGLYTSVMIAQAALESSWGQSTLGAAPNYNLFGIKGEYKGQYVLMNTLEWDPKTQSYITIKAKFKKYPNYSASMEDNAILLRYGLTYDPQFYKGTWLENAKSYKDSTAWLTGRYATDPLYSSKLNNIIEMYGLTKYDKKYDAIISQSGINNQQAKIVLTNGNHGLYNGIYNTNGDVKRIGSSQDYNKQEATITEEARTTRSTYVKFSINGQEIGWMDKRAFAYYDEIVSEISYTGKQAKIILSNGSHGLYNGVYNTNSGVKRIGSNQLYGNKGAVVLAETKTTRATYLKFSVDGKEIGWMDKRSFLFYDEVLKETAVPEKEAKIVLTNGNHGLYNGVYNTSATVKRLGSNGLYANKIATITAEAQTSRATYVKFSVAGKEIGWMDKRSFVYYDEVINKTAHPGKQAKIILANGSHGLYNGIYNTGSKVKRIGSNKNYTNKPAIITEEAKTTRSTYVKFSVAGKEIGWMDKRSFYFYDEVVSETPVANVQATIVASNGSHGLYNGPYNTSAAVRRIGSNALYVGKIATITEEVKTTRATYVKFSVNGKEIGWMDKLSFQY